jgi:hypothetical protein
LNPKASSITEVTATGVPNPARASSKAPNENAMRIAWMVCPPIYSSFLPRSPTVAADTCGSALGTRGNRRG